MSRRIRERDPEALRSFREGRVLASAGRLAEAAEAYERALSHDKNFAEALVNVGIVYSQMGPERAPRAVARLTRAIQVAPTSARAQYNLGVALASQHGRSEDAIAAFERALELEPGHHRALYALSVQHTRRDDSERASIYYARYRDALELRQQRRSAAQPEQRPRPTLPVPSLRIRFVR